ncbi:SRPBCC family protein [Micromonospora zhanjiangensis]|uniref:SRPBCC family protein n=1 Tax=Micromonospora zhanjiangensis TaxID=1522057 RepID=A0ABV8KIB1_9ACTN
MREGTFQYTIQARCTPERAMRTVAELDRHRELHPLIVAVRAVPPAPGALRGWLITDRLACGPFRFPITYRVDLLSRDDHQLVMVARQRPATTVRNHTTVTPEPDGLVRIDVTITLAAPTPLFGYAFRQARAAHLILATRTRAALEAEPSE